MSLRWRHNEWDGVSNHQPHDCLLNRLYRRRSKNTSKPHVTGLCAGNSPVNSPHKWPVTRKLFPFDAVIMVIRTFCLFVHLRYIVWSCIVITRLFTFLCNVLVMHIAFIKLRAKVHTAPSNTWFILLKNHARSQRKYTLLHISQHRDRCWFITGWLKLTEPGKQALPKRSIISTLVSF